MIWLRNGQTLKRWRENSFTAKRWLRIIWVCHKIPNIVDKYTMNFHFYRLSRDSLGFFFLVFTKRETSIVGHTECFWPIFRLRVPTCWHIVIAIAFYQTRLLISIGFRVSYFLVLVALYGSSVYYGIVKKFFFFFLKTLYET